MAFKPALKTQKPPGVRLTKAPTGVGPISPSAVKPTPPAMAKGTSVGIKAKPPADQALGGVKHPQSHSAFISLGKSNKY